MAKPASLLQGVQGFARDYPRDGMPQGLVWDIGDYVPSLLDAQFTGRGAWSYASDAIGGSIVGGIYAPFLSGDRLLVCGSDAKLYDIGLVSGTATAVTGTMPVPIQNPVMHRDRVIVPDGAGAVVPKFYTVVSSALTPADAPATCPKFKYATVYKDRLLGANYTGQEQQLVFSKPGDPTAAWEPTSMVNSSGSISAIGALRAMILIFHQGSVERVRGTTPPDLTAGDIGDMTLESLHDRTGCGDARTLAYWQDNAVFADERGCHLTDGAIVRNLIGQGGLLSYWRTLYRDKSSVAAQTYLDYYIITVVRTSGLAVTLICDLNRKAWFRFSNIKAISYISSVGTQANLWGGRAGDNRLMTLAPCFFPVTPRTTLTVDGDGTNVLPVVETPWYRITQEGRKRVRFAYVSYDARNPPSDVAMRWRRTGVEPLEIEPDAATVNGLDARAFIDLLELGYIENPSDLTYQIAGNLPGTDRYSRFRIPIGKQPYGVAFRLRQTQPTSVTRLYDIAVDAWPEERSRT